MNREKLIEALKEALMGYRIAIYTGTYIEYENIVKENLETIADSIIEDLGYENNSNI